MKKHVAIVLAILMTLGLAACGRSDASSLDAQINATMEKVRDYQSALNEAPGVQTRAKEAAILLEFEDEIAAEEAAYAELSEKERAQVTKSDYLKHWREGIALAKKYQFFAGTWRDTNSKDVYIFNADGTYQYSDRDPSAYFFPKENVLALDGWKSYDIVEDSGITKLIVQWMPYAELVRQEDYDALVAGGQVIDLTELQGVWVDCYMRIKGREDRTFTLNEDGTSITSSGSSDIWRIWEDGSLYVDGFLYEIHNTDGYFVLLRNKECFVKESDYDAFFSKHLVKADITQENIDDYIKEVLTKRSEDGSVQASEFGAEPAVESVPVSEASSTCPKCGEAVGEGMRFCPYCGADLSAEAADVPKTEVTGTAGTGNVFGEGASEAPAAAPAGDVKAEVEAALQGVWMLGAENSFTFQNGTVTISSGGNILNGTYTVGDSTVDASLQASNGTVAIHLPYTWANGVLTLSNNQNQQLTKQ